MPRLINKNAKAKVAAVGKVTEKPVDKTPEAATVVITTAKKVAPSKLLLATELAAVRHAIFHVRSTTCDDAEPTSLRQGDSPSTNSPLQTAQDLVSTQIGKSRKQLDQKFHSGRVGGSICFLVQVVQDRKPCLDST